MDTTVNINAIPILSKILGCKSNKGNINNCIRTANTKPLPTSIILSFISFIGVVYIICHTLSSFKVLYITVCVLRRKLQVPFQEPSPRSKCKKIANSETRKFSKYLYELLSRSRTTSNRFTVIFYSNGNYLLC